MKKFLTFFAACAVFVVGCGDSASGGTEATTGGTTGAAGTTGTTADKSASTTGTSTPTAGGEPTFAAVQTVLKQNCVGCHQKNSPNEGVDLTSYEAVMKGGEHGAIVKPGDAENSVLVQVLRAGHGKKQMPPAGAMSDDKIKTIEDWVKAGAKA